MKYTFTQEKIMSIIRIALAWIFIWPFFDKLLGLGFTTAPENAWINGGSPTYGFLMHGTRGPLAEFFQGLAGSPAVDWIFMLGLLCIGLGLLFGVMKIFAVLGGVIMLMLMWLAALPPEHNPFLDDHIVYSLMLIALIAFPSGWLSFEHQWRKLSMVRKHKILS